MVFSYESLEFLETLDNIESLVPPSSLSQKPPRVSYADANTWLVVIGLFI